MALLVFEVTEDFRSVFYKEKKQGFGGVTLRGAEIWGYNSERSKPSFSFREGLHMPEQAGH